MGKGKNKIGQNQECPCNSGRKYKKCCGPKQAAAAADVAAARSASGDGNRAAYLTELAKSPDRARAVLHRGELNERER